MKKIIKFLFYLIIIAGLGLAGYIAYIKYFAKAGTVDAFNTVPKESFLIVETTDISKAWNTIKKTDLWQHLVGTRYFGDIQEDIDDIDMFLDSNIIANELFTNTKIIMSAVVYSRKDWDFLFSVDLGKVQATVKTLDKLIDMIDGYSVVRFTMTAGNKKYTVIKMKDNEYPDDIYYITYAGNVLLVAFKPEIIRKSLEQYTDNHWQNDRLFKEIMQKIPERKLFKIYVNYKMLDDFMNTYLTQTDDVTQIFSNSLAYSVLNFDIDKNLFILDGFANLDSVGGYLKAFTKVEPGKLLAYKIMTNQTAAYVSFGFNDYRQFYQNLLEQYRKDSPDDAAEMDKSLNLLKNVIKIDIDRDFISWIGKEIAIFKIRPLSKDERAEDVVLTIHTNDIEAAKLGLKTIVEQIRKWSPFKFTNYEYNGFEINILKQKGFFKPFLGKIMDGVEVPYFTYIEDFVVFSNSEQTLKQVIDDYVMGRTLSNDEKFQDFMDNFSNKSSVGIFINMPKMYPTLYYYTPPEDRKDLKDNEILIESFARLGFQLTAKTKFWKTTLIGEYDSTAYYEDLVQILSQNSENTDFDRYLDSMAFEIQLPADLPDGKFIDYFDDNKTIIKTEGLIVGGKPDGLWRSYYESGNIKSAIIYDAGVPIDVGKFYYDDKNNTIQAEVNFEDGKINGLVKQFYPNGARKSKIEYKTGLKDGTAEFYYKTGELKIKAKFKDGKKNGRWIYFDKEGNKITVEVWRKGKKVRDKKF